MRFVWTGEKEEAPGTARERARDDRGDSREGSDEGSEKWRESRSSWAGGQGGEGELPQGVEAGGGSGSFSPPRTAHCGSGSRHQGLQGKAKLVQVNWVTVRDYHVFWRWRFSNCIILLVLDYPPQESRGPSCGTSTSLAAFPPPSPSCPSPAGATTASPGISLPDLRAPPSRPPSCSLRAAGGPSAAFV